jgi:hypothetical protein
VNYGLARDDHSPLRNRSPLCRRRQSDTRCDERGRERRARSPQAPRDRLDTARRCATRAPRRLPRHSRACAGTELPCAVAPGRRVSPGASFAGGREASASRSCSITPCAGARTSIVSVPSKSV